MMIKSYLKVIVVVAAAAATITIVVTSILLPTSVLAENGVIQIQIRGAGVGDNLKISAYTDRDSWEWRDSFTIGDNLVKQVNGVSIGAVSYTHLTLPTS